MGAESEYNKMNWLYNALYGDMTSEEIKKLYFISEHEKLLKEYTPERSSVIDVSCGNGVKTTALAMNGYEVTATDISEEMINLTNEFASKHNVNLSTNRSAWIELPNIYNKEFDIVLCIGNSLVHSLNKEERRDNLKAMSLILKHNGTLVIETRNWDKIIKENKEFTVGSKISYRGIDYIPLYHWILDGIEKQSKVEILFQEIDALGNVALHKSDLTFTPFTYKSIIDMLQELNMEVTKGSYSEDCDWYYVYAKNIK